MGETARVPAELMTPSSALLPISIKGDRLFLGEVRTDANDDLLYQSAESPGMQGRCTRRENETRQNHSVCNTVIPDFTLSLPTSHYLRRLQNHNAPLLPLNP